MDTVQKILIVDDDESVLEYVEEALSTLGYGVVACTTATQALGKLRTTADEFPVIISDIMMPGISGLEFLHMVRKEYPNSMVIMLTAYASTESAIRALNEGAFSYLKKPIDFDELRTTVKNAFEKYGLSRKNQVLIQELKEASEFSDTIVRHLTYTVVATDAQGNIKKINKAMENILGYKEEELKGLPLTTILGKDLQSTAWGNLMSKGQVKDFPVSLRTKKGRDIPLLFSGTIMKDFHGNMIGFLGTIIRREV
jgi:PAS domain S-box-containing protein